MYVFNLPLRNENEIDIWKKVEFFTELYFTSKKKINFFNFPGESFG